MCPIVLFSYNLVLLDDGGCCWTESQGRLAKGLFFWGVTLCGSGPCCGARCCLVSSGAYKMILLSSGF